MEELFPDVVLPISTGAGRDVCVAAGASPDEVLWLTARERAADDSVFPKAMAVHLHSFRPGPEITTQPYKGRQRPHFVQRTRDGVLFASARQRAGEPNGWVIDGSGRVVRRLSLGDGLSDVRVSPAGTIWAAYFDEGVFGGGDGAQGVVARDHFGGKLWAFDAQKAGTEDIADVYAFNLSAEDDVWVYFYTPFEIVRWRKNKPTVWQTRVEGARAIAVRPAEALLLGDYDDPTSLRILDLPKGGGRARVKRRLRLRLPKGTDAASLHAFGAAHRLALWSNQDLMILERW
ncbi:MAG TPA: hypothetical protein VHH90_04525 [Polyangia bacterium]|nr:hypothetical protein [Polyangia bacterium]